MKYIFLFDDTRSETRMSATQYRKKTPETRVPKTSIGWRKKRVVNCDPSIVLEDLLQCQPPALDIGPKMCDTWNSVL